MALAVFNRQPDAIAALLFPLLMAFFALLAAPSQQVAAVPAVPDLAELQIVESEQLFEPVSKEIDLDLPYIVEDEQVAEQQSGWLSYTIKRHDTLDKILRRISTDEEARRFLVTQKMASYRKLRSGRQLEYKVGDGEQLVALRYKASPELHLNFSRDGDGAMLINEAAPTLETLRQARSALISEQNNSLFAASDEARVPDAVIQQVIDTLETRIDFQRDTRLGDSFSLVYEELRDEDGEYAGPGRLLGLKYINRGNAIIGMLNEQDQGFYTPEGESLQKAFLRSPLKFSRISSRYSNARFHPVLKKWRAHRGVDFAAPTNTPVRASGDGVVSFVGTKGGYGKTVMIKHFDKYLTLYGHLNKYAKIKKGSKVAQGQVIGYVGSTGLATGPHLHYEFRINNVHKDPLSSEVPTNKPPLAGEQLAAFSSSTASVLAQL